MGRLLAQMHGGFALLSILTALAKCAWAGQTNLRHNSSRLVEQATLGEPLGANVSIDRRLSLKTCGELHADPGGSTRPWVVYCGGPLPGKCYTPVCPAGFSVDNAKEKCLIKDWEAPWCEPWTIRVEIRSDYTERTVDLTFPLKITAYGTGNWVSFAEDRPVTVLLTGATGTSGSWTVPMSSGQGNLNLKHTVAEHVYLRLAGSDYDDDVAMGTLNVTLLHGATTRYVFRDSTLTGTVDAPVKVFVEAKDQYGNLATSEQRGLSIAWNDGQTNREAEIFALAGGVGTALVSAPQPGSYQVSFKDPMHSTANISATMDVILDVGTAVRAVFEIQDTPANLASRTYTAGTTPVFEIIVQDKYGNFVPTYSGAITFVATTGSSVVNIANGRGSASFRHTVAETIIFSLQDHAGTGLDVTDTLVVKFVAAAAVKVGLSAQSLQGTVDAPLPIVLRALDQFDNVNLDESRKVVVDAVGDVSGGAGTDRVSGDGEATFAQGTATMSISSKNAQDVQVGLSDGNGLNVDATLTLKFKAGAAAKITMAAPQSAVVEAGASVTLQAVDQYDNNALGDLSVKLLATTPATVSNSGVAQLVIGQASMQVNCLEAKQINLHLDDSQFNTGLDVTATASIVFNAGPATRYVLSAISGQTSGSVDSTIPVKVRALDQHGNLATSEQRGVGLTWAISDSQSSTVAVTIENGEGTGQVSHTKPGNVKVKLTDTSNTNLDVSSELMVTFIPGAPRAVGFQAGLVASGTVDAALGIVLLALDQYANVATGAATFNVDLQTTGSSVTGAGQVSLALGRGPASISSERPQSVVISMTCDGTGFDCSATTTLTFSAGAPARVELTSPGSVAVGSTANLQLNAFDKFGNNVNQNSGTIAVAADSADAEVSNGGQASLDGGNAVLTIRNTKAQTVVLSLSETETPPRGLQLSSPRTMIFLAGPATKFVFPQGPGPITNSVDVVASVTVEARDQYGNLATSCHDDVSIASSKFTTFLVDIDAGRGVADITHTVPEEVDLSLDDTQTTNLNVAATLKIQFLPGAAKSVEMTVTGASTGTVDSPLSVTLRALDRFGNLATSEQRSVQVRWNSGTEDKDTKVDFASGVGQAAISRTRPGTATVAMADQHSTGLTVSATVQLTFAAGAPTSIALVAPGSGVAGQDVMINLKTLDQYGNLADTGSPSVTLQASGEATISNTGVVQLSSGIASATLRDTKAETVQVSMQDTFSTGLDVSSTGSIVIVAAAAVRFVFTTTEAQVSVDDEASIDISALDQYGNLATGAEDDVGAVASVPSGRTVSLDNVDIIHGKGVLKVSHTYPEIVTLELTDTFSTNLQVSGTQAKITFVAGAAKKIVMNASQTDGTVDAPLLLELFAEDKYGNLAVSENSEVTVQASGTQVSGYGPLQLVQGKTEARISSELPQTVPVSMSGSANAGLDTAGSVQLTFSFGSLYKFSMQSDTTLVKVGRVFPVNIKALDQYGNLVADGSQKFLESDIEPTPENISKLELTLSNGAGMKRVEILEPGIFLLRLSDAVDEENGQNVSSDLLTSAVARSDPFQVEFRLDVTPPDYNTLKIESLTSSSVEFGVYDLTEPADLWCIAANASGPNPLTPASTSDGAVFSALRGGATSSWPSVIIARSSTQLSPQATLNGLEAGRTYALRCAAADEFGNLMVAGTILGHQLVFDAPAPTPAPSPEDSGLSTGALVGIIVPSILVPLICFCIVIWFCTSRRGKDQKDMAKVVPEPGVGDKLAGDPNTYPDSGDHKGGTNGANGATTNGSESPAGLASATSSDLPENGPSGFTDKLSGDSEDEVVEVPGQNDEALLAEALKLEEELLAELLLRGGADADFDSSGDESIDSDTSAVLRDVKHFLGQKGRKRSEEEELVLPDLPLMLSDAEEERIASLLSLAQTNDLWADQLENFDKAWDGVDGIWEETRRAARAKQQDIRLRIDEVRRELEKAREAVEVFPESYELPIINALSEQAEEYEKETGKHLIRLHQIAIDWPEEDARLREATLEEWGPKIKATKDKKERQALRLEATQALRKLGDERENALDVKLEEMEMDAAGAMEDIRAARASAWQEMCKDIDGKAAGLRKKVADLRLEFAKLVWEAEDNALQATLKLRRDVRDLTVEREWEREAVQREEDLKKYTAEIHDRLPGDEDHIVHMRERALKALDRAAQGIKKAALDEKERRKQHWHGILAERGRDRIRAAKRAYLDEERKLSDESAQAQQDALELEERRRNGLLLGAQHRSEAALLTIASAIDRGRILMGLQATAADSVAEERLPRKGPGVRGSGRPIETPKGTHEPTESMSSTNNPDMMRNMLGAEMDMMPMGTSSLSASISSSSLAGAGQTNMNWKIAKESAVEELNEAVGVVGESLLQHGETQRKLLAQRQNREVLLATAPESDDEKREDLFDALEENMRRELRDARWQFQVAAAIALAERPADGSGAETDLGKKMKEVVRESDHLEVEDEIGEKYDRLRAFVLRGKDASAEDMAEIKEAQAQAKALEEQAAELVASLDEHSDSDGEEEARRAAEARRAERQRRRKEIEDKVKELQEKGQFEEAMELLATALREETEASNNDWDIDEELAKGPKFQGAPKVSVESPEAVEAGRSERRSAEEEAMAERLQVEAETERLKNEESQSQREERIQQALKQSQDLHETGWTEEAVAQLRSVLAEEGEALDAERESELARIKADLLTGLEAGGVALPEELEAQRRKVEEMRKDRRRRREEALEKLKALQDAGNHEEAIAVVTEALAKEVATAQKEEAVLNALIADVDLARLKDSFSQGMDARDQKLADDAEEQRSRMEARRAERQRRRKEAEQKAEALKKEGNVDEALAVMASELADEGDASDADFDAAVSSAIDAASMRDGMAAGLKGADQAVADELEQQRLRAQRAREARKKRREEAQAEAKALQEEGKGEEAMNVLSDALEKDAAAAAAAGPPPGLDADAIGKMRDGALAEDAEEQRRRLEARRAARRKGLKEAQEQAAELMKDGRTDEALNVMAEAMAAEVDAADAEEVEQLDFDLAKLRDKMATGLSDAEAERLKELEEQRKRVQQRRAARRKGVVAPEEAADAADAEEVGQLDRDLDGLRKKMEAGAAEADAQRLRELEEQRRRAEERRRKRREGRGEALEAAKDLQDKGEQEAAMETLNSAVQEEIAGLPEMDADAIRKMQDGAVADDAEEQRRRLEARRAARRNALKEAQNQAEDLVKDGRMDEAVNVIAEAMAEEADVADAAEVEQVDLDLDKLRDKLAEGLSEAEQQRLKELEEQRRRAEERRAARRQSRKSVTAEADAAIAEEAKQLDMDLDGLRQKMAAGMSEADAQRLKELEEQRRRVAARRAARKSRSGDAVAAAKDLQQKGNTEAAVEELNAAMQQQAAALEAPPAEDGAGMKESLAEREQKAAEDAQSQRQRAEARRAKRQQRRQEAQQLAQELQAEGKTEEALQLMVSAMADEGADSDSDWAERPGSPRLERSSTTGSQVRSEAQDKLKAGLADGLGSLEGAVAEESAAQQSKVQARLAARRRKREAAQEKAAELNQQAAELRENVGLTTGAQHGSGEGSSELDALTAWQEESRKREVMGREDEAAQKAQEEAARRLIDSSTDVTSEDKSAIKDTFAAEMERCQGVVADEREAQRLKVKKRLDARRKNRQEEKAAVKKPIKKSVNALQKVKGAFLATTQLNRQYQKKRAQIMQEHHEVEQRVRAECAEEMRQLEERLRAEMDREMSKLQAKLSREHGRPDRKADVSKTVVDEKKRETVAAVAAAHAEIDAEKKRQAQRMEKRLAARRKKLNVREANVRHAHTQEEVRLQLEKEKEKLAKVGNINKVKGKDLLRELSKVKGLVAKLQDPSSPSTRKDPSSPRGLADLAQNLRAAGQMAPPAPPDAPQKAASGLPAPAAANDESIEEESV